MTVVAVTMLAASGQSSAGSAPASTLYERLQPSPPPSSAQQDRRAGAPVPSPEKSASDAAIVTVPPITGPAEIRTPPANIDPGISATDDIDQYNRERAARQQQP